MRASEIAESIRNSIAKDTPLQEFFDSFLAEATQRRPIAKFVRTVATKRTREGKVVSCAKDVQSKLLCAVANQRLCPNYKFTIADRPMVACYPRRMRIRESAEAWAALEFPVAVSDTDILDDVSVLDRETVYMSSLLNRQHRTFVFSLAICGSSVRFLRWDRSGVVVTQRVDYAQDSYWLAEFLWRYNHLSSDPEARGFDANATPASYTESRLLTDAIKGYLGKVKAGKVPLIPHTEVSLDRTYPAYKIHVEDVPLCSFHLIIRRPFFIKEHMTSGSTRGYLAYHVQEQRLVFLKDFWNLDVFWHVSEAEMYGYLETLDVPHLPRNLFAGGVRDSSGKLQRTATHTISTHIRTKIHTRIVQNLLYPLVLAKNSRQMVQAIRDALIAIGEAYRLGNAIHGDFSAANVMLTSSGRGVLNDWDNAYFHGGPQRQQIGTWSYMSCEKLLDPDYRRHCIKDDIEASFWLLQAQTLKYFMPRHPQWTWSMFDEEMLNAAGKRCGGNRKYAFLTSAARDSEEPQEDMPVPCAPLRDLLQQFRHLLGRFYLIREQRKGLDYDAKPDGERAADQKLLESLDDPRAAIQLFDDALARDDWLEADVLDHQFFNECTDDSISVALTASFGIPKHTKIKDLLKFMHTDDGSVSSDQSQARATGSRQDETSIADASRSNVLWPPGPRMIVGGELEGTEPVDYKPPPAYIGNLCTLPQARNKKQKRSCSAEQVVVDVEHPTKRPKA